MQPVNLLTPSELNWLDVCDSLRCCDSLPGVTTLLFSSSRVVSGALLSVWLSVAAAPFHRCSWCSSGVVLEGCVTWSHLRCFLRSLRFIVRCAAGVSCGAEFGYPVLCDPRELGSVARKRTARGALQNATAQCLQVFHLWLGTGERVTCASAECLFVRG